MQQRVSVIAFGGLKGSGKSTAGNYLVEKHGFHAVAFADTIKKMVKMAFPKVTDEQLWGSSEKREELLMDYPITSCPFCGSLALIYPELDRTEQQRTCAECDASVPTHLNARILCQTLGTEWGRRMHHNVWVDRLFDEVSKQAFVPLSSGGRARFVITDCRFEYGEVKQRGGVSVLLTRGLTRRGKRATTPLHPTWRLDDLFTYQGTEKMHASEWAIMGSKISDWTAVVDEDLTLEETYDWLDSLVRTVTRNRGAAT